MRRKSQTIVKTNEVLGRFLEFIVHAPLGKHEPRHTNTTRSHSRTVDAGTRSVALDQGRRAKGRYIFLPRSREVKNGCVTKHDHSGPVLLLKSRATARSYRKRKKSRWQEIAIAAGIPCSICFNLPSPADGRRIGFRIGGPS